MLFLLLACNPDENDSNDSTPKVDFSEGKEITCTTPADYGPQRFSEQSSERNLEIDRPFFWGGMTSFDGNLIIHDIDNDGDMDILMGRTEGAPDAFQNDGTGHFTEMPRLFPDVLDRFPAVNTAAAVDMNGDNLPDLLLVGLGGVMISYNQGDWRFGEAELLWLHDGDNVPMYISFTVGDYDGDGDLDIILPGIDWLPADIYASTDPAYDKIGTPVQVLENQDGTFISAMELTPDGVAGFAMFTVFSDRDNDGDQDLLVSSIQLGFLERLAPQAFYRNDNQVFTNDATDIGMDLSISGMGGDVVDVNHDGLLDICISDTGPVKCMIKTTDGTYYDAGTAWNMVPEGFAPGIQWSGWSIEITDLDHDGHYDAAIGAGDELHPRLFWEPWKNNFEDPPAQNIQHTDTLLWGKEDGSFVDQANAIGFDTPDYHYGVVAADMDGDGFQEIIALPGGKGPDYWQNSCSQGNWITIDPIGDQNNRDAINAQITVEADGVLYIRQILPIRGFGQSPPIAHFGLGAATQVDRITITWPDGTVSTGENFGINRIITVRKL